MNNSITQTTLAEILGSALRFSSLIAKRFPFLGLLCLISTALQANKPGLREVPEVSESVFKAVSRAL